MIPFHIGIKSVWLCRWLPVYFQMEVKMNPFVFKLFSLPRPSVMVWPTAAIQSLSLPQVSRSHSVDCPEDPEEVERFSFANLKNVLTSNLSHRALTSTAHPTLCLAGKNYGSGLDFGLTTYLSLAQSLTVGLNADSCKLLPVLKKLKNKTKSNLALLLDNNLVLCWPFQRETPGNHRYILRKSHG